MIGLEGHTYEAYCLDEAVVFYGLSVENMLEEASHGKPGKEERKAQAAREALMKKLFSDDKDKTEATGFAHPAVMFL